MSYIPLPTGTSVPAVSDVGVVVRPVELPYPSFSNISSATTTTCKSGAGKLVGIVLNKPVPADTITLYNNTAASGTVIGTITVGTGTDPISLPYGLGFSTGLTVVTSGTTNLTVVYI